MTHLEARLVGVSECRKGAIAAREKVICRESLGKVGLGGGACVFFSLGSLDGTRSMENGVSHYTCYKALFLPLH